MLIGHLGKEPEIKYTDTKVAVCKFTLATTERAYTLPNGHQVPEQTDWHNVIFWGAQAEYIYRYVSKGDKLYVEGRIRKRNYTDREGRNHSVTEIWGERLELFSTPKKAVAAEASSDTPSVQ